MSSYINRPLIPRGPTEHVTIRLRKMLGRRIITRPPARNTVLAASAATAAYLTVAPARRLADHHLLPAIGSVFHGIGDLLWNQTGTFLVVGGLLVAGIKVGEWLQDRAIDRIPQQRVRQWLHDLTPGPAILWMSLACLTGLGAVADHFASTPPTALDMTYIRGLGEAGFAGSFLSVIGWRHWQLVKARRALEQSTTPDPEALAALERAKWHAKLFCLLDDIPIVALYLSSL